MSEKKRIEILSSEIQGLLEFPIFYQLLIDWHGEQESAADAMDYIDGMKWHRDRLELIREAMYDLQRERDKEPSDFLISIAPVNRR